MTTTIKCLLFIFLYFSSNVGLLTARLPQQFVIDFTLPEPAHPGTLTMTFTPQHTGATDANGPRVITFDSSFETSGRHQLSADRLSALASLAGVHTVSPSVNLVNDGIYTVVLSYQDTAQHAASPITHANVTFDTVTTPPVLSAPATVRNDALHRVS